MEGVALKWLRKGRLAKQKAKEQSFLPLQGDLQFERS